jgi:predicted SnoaL-like aldol condensation-catalyzing enzyme
MPIDHFPVGQIMSVNHPDFTVTLTLTSTSELSFVIAEGPFAHQETVAIDVCPLGNGLFTVSWTEESGATVVNVQDYDRLIVRSFVTLPDGRFLRMIGPINIAKPAERPSDALPERNKALVVDAMTALFQHHDAAAVERLYAPGYIQHNPNIPQGRDALRSIVAGLSEDVSYEPGMVIAEGAFVAIHGRIRGWSPAPQIVVDLFRVENGKLAEHWDVLQDEMAATTAIDGVSMFDPEERQR